MARDRNFRVLDIEEDPLKAFEQYHKDLRQASRAIRTPMVARGLLDTCLAITGSFEGRGFGQVTGDFDGQGLSLGILQQCLGQGSLQSMLRAFVAKAGKTRVAEILGPLAPEFLDMLTWKTSQQVSWGNKISGGRKSLVRKPWGPALKALITTPEYIELQKASAQGIFGRAITLCVNWDLWSKRAVAYAFDTVVQQGGIGEKHKKAIRDLISSETKRLGALTEVQKMTCMALARCAFSVPQWQVDALSRKLAIIRGQSKAFMWKGKKHDGAVHGAMRKIDKEFGLNDSPYTAS